MCFYVPFPYPKKCGQHFPGEGDTQTLSTRYFSRVLWLAPSSDAWIFCGEDFFHQQNHHMSHERKNTGCLGFI